MSNNEKKIEYWWSLSDRLIEIYKATNDNLVKHACRMVTHDGNNAALRVARCRRNIYHSLPSINLAEYVLKREK